jgi:hypothetical protein
VTVKGLAVPGLITGIFGLFVVPVLVFGMFYSVGKVREAGARTQEKSNLKQLSLSFHNINDTYGYCPAAAAYYTKDGKPGLSWRVAMLPFIEQDNLYKQFKFDEPWDSPHNVQLLPRIPKTYLQPGQKDAGSGLTHYQVFVGPATPFQDSGLPGKPREERPVPWPGFGPGFGPGPGAPRPGPRIPGTFMDGTSNTIAIAVAERAVPWTKPEDIPYDAVGPLPRLDRRFGYYQFGMWDGSVRSVSLSVSEQTLRNAINPADGNLLGPDW